MKNIQSSYNLIQSIYIIFYCFLKLLRPFQVRTALDFVTKAQTQRPIITFCESLDSVLGGGVFIGQIVSTVTYCTRLYCTILDCTILYCTLLYSTLLYSTLLYSTLLYSPLLYSTLLYSTLLYSLIFSQLPVG